MRTPAERVSVGSNPTPCSKIDLEKLMTFDDFLYDWCDYVERGLDIIFGVFYYILLIPLVIFSIPVALLGILISAVKKLFNKPRMV